jgi:hypothetical protein
MLNLSNVDDKELDRLLYAKFMYGIYRPRINIIWASCFLDYRYIYETTKIPYNKLVYNNKQHLIKNYY